MIVLVLCIVREIHCYCFTAIGSVMLLLLLQIPHTSRATFWGQITQVPHHQGTGKEGGTVSPGGRVPPRCQTILGQVSQMGCRGFTPPPHPPKDVHACCQGGPEGGREIYLMGLPVSLPRPNSEADVPAVQIVGYQTSQKEI